jgi:hypothetical protein
MRSFCCTSVPPINPLYLASNFRDGFGEAHARLAELLDPIWMSGCFEPRIFHAPDTQSENVGATAASPYIQYVLDIPVGSFILAYLHHAASQVNPNVATCPPVPSSFRVQITDVARSYRFFEKPVPEAFFLNDAPSMNPSGPFFGSSSGFLYELNPSPRLLTAPYPVAPPSGKFKVEFWNSLNAANTLMQLSFLVAVPAASTNGGSNNA